MIQVIEDPSKDASWWGVTLPDRRLTRLSCRKTEQMWSESLNITLKTLKL